MDPNVLIETYVRAVVRQIPAGKREEIGLELRVLLTEDLAQRAQALNRPADEAMVFDMLDAFGRPADVAARYHAPWAIIDPADTRNFILAAVVLGLAAEGMLKAGLLGADNAPAGLWWVGLLVLVFGVKSLAQRTWPEKHQWRPRSLVDHDRVSRVGHGLAIFMIGIAMLIYASPAKAIAYFFSGQIPTFDLVYTKEFTSLRSFRMPGLFGLLAGYGVILAIVAVQGHWRRMTRWLEIFFLISIAIQLGWQARTGRIFVSEGMDQLATRALAVGSALLLIDVAFKIYRELARIKAPKMMAADKGARAN